jgi:hypothetical protein
MPDYVLSVRAISTGESLPEPGEPKFKRIARLTRRQQNGCDDMRLRISLMVRV